MAVSGRRLGGWLNLVLSAAIALAIWGLAIVVSTRPALKKLWDLSPQARFTVEAATEELLDDIREQGLKVEIHTVFFPLQQAPAQTEEQRQLLGINQRLQDLTRDLLRQYDYLGGDAVEVTHHDLLQDPGRIREVMQAIQNRRYNSVILKLGNRSRVLSLEEDLAVFDHPALNTPQGMPVANQVPTLTDYKGEEAISTALKRLLVEGVPKIYFLDGYGSLPGAAVASSNSEFWAALIEDGFEMAVLDTRGSQGIPADASAVVLLNPTRELLPADAEALYRYLRDGGRVLVSLRYYEQPADWNVTLRGLADRFGFEISRELVCHEVQDPANPSQGLMGTPQCQNLVAAAMNQAHPVTRPLARQRRYPVFKAGRAIRAVGGEEQGVRVDTSLLRTGPRAWLEQRGNSGVVDYIGPPDAAAYTSRCIGAVIDVDSESSERPGHLVVLAGECFDNLSFGFNGDLALNLFNWMAQREALISIRGQRYVSRKIELTPQQIGRIGWLLVAGVPGSLLALGLFVFWRRTRT